MLFVNCMSDCKKKNSFIHENSAVYLICIFCHVNVLNYSIYILLLIEHKEIASPRHINRVFIAGVHRTSTWKEVYSPNNDWMYDKKCANEYSL